MKIKTVTNLGPQKVYSLEMQAPNHNYIHANGLLSANSHSVSYAFVSYYTAFLKANYPSEFWSAQLSYEAEQVKINRMIIEAKGDGIKVLPVSINTSQLGYIPESTTSIRRSLGTLKAVGASAIEELVKHRPYTGIGDFLVRTESRKLNKKTMHALIAAGAFDEFGVTRKTLANKVAQCKLALERYVKRRLDYYIKAAGANKSCISKPVDEDVEMLAKVDPNKNVEYAAKFARMKALAEVVFAHWQTHKPTIVKGEYESLAAAQKAELKKILGQWEAKATEIIVENEWTFNFKETLEDDQEWPLEQMITEEKAVYGTAVSAHIFDNHIEIEKKVMEKFPTNFYTLDSEYSQLGNGFELVMMVEVLSCDRQFPYKKDPSKFTRLFKIEDRFGAGDLTVFDKGYDDFMPDSRGIQIRVWKPGNIVIIKAKTNFYNGRRSLVYDKCIKLVHARSD